MTGGTCGCVIVCASHTNAPQGVPAQLPINSGPLLRIPGKLVGIKTLVGIWTWLGKEGRMGRWPLGLG